MPIPMIFELSCQARHNSWGKKGSTSLVAQLLKYQPIDENRPYAELWMGIHPGAPSHVKFGEGEELASILQKAPRLLGNYVRERWGNLPFLFKILSIAHPLSIQMHPDQVQAQELHRKDPVHYPDGNHKPEIALCLSELETLYEFEKQHALTQFLEKYPFFFQFFLEKHSDPARSSKKEVRFQDFIPCLMRSSLEESKMLLEQLQRAIHQIMATSQKEKLFLSLYPKFQEDIGLLFVFFMQKVLIPPDQALFLNAHQLHAYLKGNLAECMANSDNVIRAGLTDRYKDVEALLNQLTYHDQAPQLLSGVPSSEWSTRYSSESEEFALETIRIFQNTVVALPPLMTPSLILVLSGSGKIIFEEVQTRKEKALEQGTVLFIGAEQPFQLETPQTIEIVRALVPEPDTPK